MKHLLGIAALACAVVAQPALGNTGTQWPERSIRLVVPFPAGGPTDIAARVVGKALSDRLGTPFVIENKAGAHGFIGAGDVARSKPDGYTLMMASIGTMAINPGLYPDIPYDANKDFTPLALVLTVPIAVVINPQQMPVQTVGELVDYLKANPDRVNYGSAGNGGSSHLVPEYFKYKTGTSMTHIPYKGSSPAVTDLVAGQVQVMFDTLLTSTPFVKAGKLRMLAVTTAQRLPDYPQVPTMAEALGAPDFEASSWFAMYAPAGTPQAVQQKLSLAINQALGDAAVKQRLAELGAVPAGGTPGELADFQQAEQRKWAQVIKAAGILPD